MEPYSENITDPKNLGENIRKLRLQRRLSQGELAALLDIKQAAVSHYETGRRTPSFALLGRIAHALNITISDITTRLTPKALDAPAAEIPFKPAPPRSEDTLPIVILQEDYLQSDQRNDFIPILTKTAAGTPIEATDGGYPPGIAEKLVCYPACKDRNAYALYVEGDSMVPGFLEGDIIIVSPNTPFSDNMPALILFESSGHTFKITRRKNHAIEAVPINKDYQITTYGADEIRAVHPVIGKVPSAGV